MKEILETIKETNGKLEVKNLRFITLDNVIVGQVKCPLFGKPTIHDGFISCTWTKQGKPLRINKGRTELELNIVYETH